jgi:hypothetical protein
MGRKITRRHTSKHLLMKKRELDMITWKHYKAWPLEVMRRFMGGCLNVEEGEENEEGDDD